MSERKRILYVQTSGVDTPERTYTPFILATTAAMMDIDATIYFLMRARKLRDKLIKDLLDPIPYSFLNGHPTKRLPNNIAVRYSFIEGESILLSLDTMGVAASSGSACTAKTLEPSHVLRAIGLKHEEAHGSLLFTLGKQNTGEEVDHIISIMPDIVKRLRAMSPLTPKELKE